MAEQSTGPQIDHVVRQVEAAASSGAISAGAARNIRQWLVEPRYARYAAEVASHVRGEKWQILDDVFWTVIPFGTGGRRGRMYPIGSNAINDRTIGESAQGLANYVRACDDAVRPLSCAIAYDTRHRSRHFAELCAGIMVAAGFKVYFLDDYRSTPELSLTVRRRNCSCGIMVTASHNPPSDNAVKVYWSTGGQILPPHDTAIIDEVMNVQDITGSDFREAVADGHIEICTADSDQAYVEAVARHATPGPRELSIVFTPLHGVGASAVCPVLESAGFHNVEVYGPHAEPSGDFPNVPGHVSNPENPAVFDGPIDRARQTGADLVLATDPDCDRMGCAAPLTLNDGSPWSTFTGNQLGALLADYVLETRQQRGAIRSRDYIVKTLVTTEMIRRIGDYYGVRTFGNLLVGFKWIAGVIDQEGPDRFVFGTEESHGFLVGQYARDKDGGVACLLMAELAAQARARGLSLHEKLDALYWQHGYHAERLITVTMPGSEGMSRMQHLMRGYREDPPATLGGIPVAACRDYASGAVRRDGRTEPLDGPTGDLVILDLAEPGNYVAVRPSGTEPKVKFYLFAYTAAEELASVELAKRDAAKTLDAIEADLRQAGA